MPHDYGCVSLLLSVLPKLSSHCYSSGSDNLGNLGNIQPNDHLLCKMV